MNAATFSWDFPKTLTTGRTTYTLVPQTRRSFDSVSREQHAEFSELVSSAFDGDCLLPVKSDAYGWFGWMLVQDMTKGVTYAALVDYSDLDGTFAHQWCRVRVVTIDNASAEDFDDIVAEIQAREIECRAIVD